MAILCAPATSAAQPKPPQAGRVTLARPAQVADGMLPGELYMEADEIIRDDEHKTSTAQGSVEVRYEGRTLRADKVTYQQGEQSGQGVIRAIGHVQVINADGTVEFADEFVLDDEMRAGVALAFSARAPVQLPQPGEIKLAAASVVRRSESIQELNEAIYTPCPICADGQPKTPSWSISADRIVQDKAHRLIYYRNARIRVFGVPVFYLPVFWHADPSADRSSGFLAPKLQVSDRRGFSYEQPYLFALSPYSDLIVSPQINTKVNPFLNTRFRKRFYTGEIDARFGYTYSKDFDGQGNQFGPETSRSYVLARGGFHLNDYWRWGFTAERTSDRLLFDKYQIGDVYETRGQYVADDRRLISQIYAARQDQASYFSAAAFSIQGLRFEDNNRTIPVVAPLIESHFDMPQEIAGGRLRFDGSAVALTRAQSPQDVALNLAGLDSRRATAELDWRRSYTAPAGLRVEPFVHARVDAYSVSNAFTDGIPSPMKSESLVRGLGVAGADITYPFYRRFGDATVVLEPIAQIALSPNAEQVVVAHDPSGNPIYLNEDSITVELDESNLFRANKFPGFDLYEDGQRLNVGGRTEILWDDGRRANLLIGRSFRAQRNNVFPLSSGLRGTSSDWIVAGDAQPVKGLTMFGRARLDSDTLKAHRIEGGVNFSHARTSGYFRYLKDDQGVMGLPMENIDVGGDFRVTEHWGFTVYGNRDLLANAWVIRDVGIYYRDDCARVDVIYSRQDTIQGRLGPSDSFALRLTLATLGTPFTVR